MFNIARSSLILCMIFITNVHANEKFINADMIMELHGEMLKDVSGDEADDAAVRTIIDDLLNLASSSMAGTVSQSEFNNYVRTILIDNIGFNISLQNIIYSIINGEINNSNINHDVAILMLASLIYGDCDLQGTICAVKGPNSSEISAMIGVIESGGDQNEVRLREVPEIDALKFSSRSNTFDCGGDCLFEGQMQTGENNGMQNYKIDIVNIINEKLYETNNLSTNININLNELSYVRNVPIVSADLFMLEGQGLVTSQIIKCYQDDVPRYTEAVPKSAAGEIAKPYITTILGTTKRYISAPDTGLGEIYGCGGDSTVIRGNVGVGISVKYGLTASDTIAAQIPYAYTCNANYLGSTVCLGALFACLIVDDVFNDRSYEDSLRSCLAKIFYPVDIGVNSIGLNGNYIGLANLVMPGAPATTRPGFIASAPTLESRNLRYGTNYQAYGYGLPLPMPYLFPAPTSAAYRIPNIQSPIIGGEYLFSQVMSWRPNVAYASNDTANQIGCSYYAEIDQARVNGDTFWLIYGAPDFKSFLFGAGIYENFMLFGFCSIHNPLIPGVSPNIPINPPNVPTIPPLVLPTLPGLPPLAIPPAPSPPSAPPITIPPIPAPPRVPPVAIPTPPKPTVPICQPRPGYSCQ